ncbi:hypothetical protein PR003_g17671 [Phytophthora rubi]|uniref:Uncharacterized protein n=2 Tax=Phytophthora TaxID=4783 RepID=A0A6A4END7_9STRA|nr:hypothetical protein PF008_g24086 [Phytophthora fragariae]KAE9320604.1 hypothetical protein PR003_g17671 [Phytophthora rubi]
MPNYEVETEWMLDEGAMLNYEVETERMLDEGA